MKGDEQRVDVRELIYRVVTGDGAQLENLDMTEDEWREECQKLNMDPDHFEITMKLEDWLEMVRVARKYAEGGERR